ncbi:hypothetical protein [Parabacteroides leei]|nr:hypothetical protein [Parabacteroides leei]
MNKKELEEGKASLKRTFYIIAGFIQIVWHQVESFRKRWII